ncbi:hypothetical protein G7K_6737-t1 [Saitoella complicata NRRL Y-17804]|uniref:Uncharacterized protein n=1 Tax=Saitoella complicata (strain BCRC 22490 / CBS 7301 / JCM 7358 / NBRC 10748 / NRRL Y-17804) TaxID=698492 RepID=A0A0E9NTC5_SAICN|nr:hypothetical protein G7K_6737-t1 [Saitoella complicata NRRL Y-17804]
MFRHGSRAVRLLTLTGIQQDSKVGGPSLDSIVQLELVGVYAIPCSELAMELKSSGCVRMSKASSAEREPSL